MRFYHYDDYPKGVFKILKEIEQSQFAYLKS